MNKKSLSTNQWLNITPLSFPFPHFPISILGLPTIPWPLTKVMDHEQMIVKDCELRKMNLGESFSLKK